MSVEHPMLRLDSAVTRIASETAGRRRTGTNHDVADASVGTIATDDAIGFDPRPVLRSLAMHHADVVVIGQIAGIMHGSVELTGDLDLLWDGSVDRAGAVARAFADLGADLTDDDGRPIACDATAFRLPKVLYRTPTAAGDCCTTRLNWGGLHVDEFIRRAESAVHPGDAELQARYLRLDDLITMRRAVGRPKDLRRAEELERMAAERSPCAGATAPRSSGG